MLIEVTRTHTKDGRPVHSKDTIVWRNCFRRFAHCSLLDIMTPTKPSLRHVSRNLMYWRKIGKSGTSTATSCRNDGIVELHTSRCDDRQCLHWQACEQ